MVERSTVESALDESVRGASIPESVLLASVASNLPDLLCGLLIKGELIQGEQAGLSGSAECDSSLGIIRSIPGNKGQAPGCAYVGYVSGLYIADCIYNYCCYTAC